MRITPHEWLLARELDNAAKFIEAMAALHGLHRDQTGRHIKTRTPIGENELERAWETETLAIDLETVAKVMRRQMHWLSEDLA